MSGVSENAQYTSNLSCSQRLRVSACPIQLFDVAVAKAACLASFQIARKRFGIHSLCCARVQLRALRPLAVDIAAIVSTTPRQDRKNGTGNKIHF